MTDIDKIKLLRSGLMCAIIHLFNSKPQNVIDAFSLSELEEFAEVVETFGDEPLEGIFKDVLNMTE